ncbi:hypothetical protein ABFV05_020771 [Capra hircus]
MSALSSRLWDMPLHHLSNPGSHSTMPYCLHKKSPISHKEWRLLKLLGNVLPCVTLPVVLKWSTTQHHEAPGCWCEDLQMAHMEEGTKSNLHSGHMVYTMALMEDMLTEISEWLENHPQEEVILACRNLEGMMEDLHEYLKCCIKNIFGDMLCACGMSRGHRLPMLLAAGAVGALGLTVIRLSTHCVRLIQAPGTPIIDTSLLKTPK